MRWLSIVATTLIQSNVITADAAAVIIRVRIRNCTVVAIVAVVVWVQLWTVIL
jgi:hypothetical protein